MFKYNPFSSANYSFGDSIDLRKVAFVDNEFQGLFGLMLSNVRNFGIENNAKMVNLGFVDASMATYLLSNSPNPASRGFRNFNINAGYQFGLITNTDFGLIGFTLSPQLNYIHIYEEQTNGTSFEELTKSIEKISRNIMGAGFKLNVPVNDFCFFFEARKYYPLDNGRLIPGLTDRMIFSFGGIATGTVFKNKTKE